MVSKKSIITEKWTMANGNPCFRFKESGSSFHFWRASSEQRAIDKAVHEIMDGIVARNAEEAGVSVVKTKVLYDYKGTYGLISGRFYLALLKDGSVWEFPIVYHDANDDEAEYYECEQCYSVSENQQHIRAVESLRWNRVTRCLVLSDKARMDLLLAGILLVGGLLFFLIVWLIKRIKWWSMLILVGFVILFCITEWVASKAPGKGGKIMRIVGSVPMAFLYIVTGLTQPFIAIVGTYFMVAMFAFGGPFLVLLGLNSLCGWALHTATIAFLVLSFGSIICAHSYATTKWLIHHSPLQNWGNHAYEEYREELADYVMHPSNVVFVLYFLYLVFLAVSGFFQIQSDSYLVSKEYDAAVLKAFLVFIAFTNMRIKARDAEFDVKELLRKTLLLFVHDKLEEQGKED